MIIAKGEIVDCADMDSEEYCRITVKVKVANPKERLKRLNAILGIATIEV